MINALETFEDNNFTYIVFPLYGPTLYDAIYYNDPCLSTEDIRTIARQLIEATKLFHDNHMIHSDIKPRNILLNRFYKEPNKQHFYRKPDITLCD